MVEMVRWEMIPLLIVISLGTGFILGALSMDWAWRKTDGGYDQDQA